MCQIPKCKFKGGTTVGRGGPGRIQGLYPCSHSSCLREWEIPESPAALGPSAIWQIFVQIQISPQASLWLLVRTGKSCPWIRHWEPHRTWSALSSSAHTGIPEHRLAVPLSVSLGDLPLQQHLLCREPGTFLISINPALSQVCRWAPGCESVRGIPAQPSLTAGTLAESWIQPDQTWGWQVHSL